MYSYFNMDELSNCIQSKEQVLVVVSCVVSCHALLCSVVSCCVAPCRVVLSCRVVLCCAVSCRVVFGRDVSCFVVWCLAVLYRVRVVFNNQPTKSTHYKVLYKPTVL